MKKLKPGDYETIDGCSFTKAVDVTSEVDAVEHGDVTFAALTAILGEALRFDHDWILAHLDPARTGQWTRDKLESTLASQYPLGLGARDLDPLYVCQDPDFLDEVRTDPNVRTAYQGVCLDLRPWYGPKAAPDCGEMPARPELLTALEHPGNIPPRAPAWCAMQTWTGTGPLPAP
jgi:hypothetical protein